jgi:hypothetical protein
MNNRWSILASSAASESNQSLCLNSNRAAQTQYTRGRQIHMSHPTLYGLWPKPKTQKF